VAQNATGLAKVWGEIHVIRGVKLTLHGLHAGGFFTLSSGKLGAVELGDMVERRKQAFCITTAASGGAKRDHVY
jgi:hypothetical protein